MNDQISFEFEQRKPIKGYPELHWTGKRPYTSTQYYPAQLKESYGEPKDGWMNKIFWGDNLQVMSHLLKDYRGSVNLVYIDPPFDSKATYKKEIKVKGQKTVGDNTAFEEKQYGDIWTNDEYLQFMYERLILIKELLADDGSIFLHCDWHRGHQLRCLMDEVFGPENFVNEIAWCYYGPGSPGMRQFNRKHDTIFWYSKNGSWKFNADDIRVAHDEKTTENFKQGLKGSGFIAGDYNLASGKIPEDWWEMAIAGRYPNDGIKRVGYPTEKPQKLLERIIKTVTDEDDLVFDCFMGSGVTQSVSAQLKRRFIGADINMASVMMVTKRLLNVSKKDNLRINFEVFNVNNYELFRNPVEAKELIMDAFGIQKFDSSIIYDGELDGYMVKIMPTNRIATKADLEELKANLPYKTFEKRKEENPGAVVERIKIICMGHEADLKASLEQELSSYKLDIEIVDILRDKSDLQFKREADANVVKENGTLTVKEFYPMNLLQKLSMQKESVEDWRQLSESIFIDWNYDGQTMRPEVCDIPGKDELVTGVYEIPDSAGRIKIKITDLLSESLELEV